MLAGHILLVTFALLTQSLITAETQQLLLKPMAILPFFMLVFLTAFEVLVGLPAGLHLHDPHRRVHRRLGSPRALIALIGTDRRHTPASTR